MNYVDSFVKAVEAGKQANKPREYFAELLEKFEQLMKSQCNCPTKRTVEGKLIKICSCK